MFNASYFTYDGVYSGDYGLQIASFDSQNVETTNVFAPTFKTMKSSRAKSFLHAGIKYETPPTFDFQIISQEKIGDFERREILSWLTARQQFKQLKIHSVDLQDYDYNCVFSSVNIIYVNGQCHGFQVTATFDSWLCIGQGKSIDIPQDANLVDGYYEATIVNKSDLPDEYVYASIEIKNASYYEVETDAEANKKKYKYCSIINDTDDSHRETEFFIIQDADKEPPPSLTLTLDGDTRLIMDNNGLGRLSCFNKKWLRLKKGKNKLQIRINGTIKIKCPTYVMIGF